MKNWRTRVLILKLTIGQRRLKRLQNKARKQIRQLNLKEQELPKALMGTRLKELTLSQQTKDPLLKAMEDWYLTLTWLESLLRTKETSLRQSLKQR